MIKLSQYAKMMGVTYRTAWNWFKAGKIEGAIQMHSGTILVPSLENRNKEENEAKERS